MKKTNFIFINFLSFFFVLFLSVLFIPLKTFFITSYSDKESLFKTFSLEKNLDNSEKQKKPLKTELKSEVWESIYSSGMFESSLFYFKEKGRSDFEIGTWNLEKRFPDNNHFFRVLRLRRLKSRQRNNDRIFFFWIKTPQKNKIPGEKVEVTLEIAMLSPQIKILKKIGERWVKKSKTKLKFVFFLRKKVNLSRELFNEFNKTLEYSILPGYEVLPEYNILPEFLQKVLEELKGYFSNFKKNYFHSRSWKLFWKKNQLQNLCVLATENEKVKKIISNFNENTPSAGLFGNNDFEFTETKFTLKLIDFLEYPALIKDNKLSNEVDKEENYQNCSKSRVISLKFLTEPAKLYRKLLYDYLFIEEVLDPEKLLPLFKQYLKNNQFIKSLKKPQGKEYNEQKKIFVENRFPDEKKEKLFDLINNLFDKNPFLYKLDKIDKKYDIDFFRNHSKIFYCFSLDNSQFSCNDRNEEYISLKKFTKKLLILKKSEGESSLPLSLLKLEFNENEITFLDWMLQNFETKKYNFIFTKFVNTFFWIWINVKNLKFFEKDNFFEKTLIIKDSFTHTLDQEEILEESSRQAVSEIKPEYNRMVLNKDIFNDQIVFLETETDFLYKKENFLLNKEEFAVYLKTRLNSIFKWDKTHKELSKLPARSTIMPAEPWMTAIFDFYYLLTSEEFTDETFEKFQANWDTAKENFYFSFFLEEEFNFPLNEYGLNFSQIFSQIFFKSLNRIHKLILNNPHDASRNPPFLNYIHWLILDNPKFIQNKKKGKEELEKLFFKNVKEFFMRKTASKNFQTQEKKSFWTFLFSLKKKSKEETFSLNSFLKRRWDEWFGDSITSEKKALNLKYVLNLVLWGELTFPMISLDLPMASLNLDKANKAKWLLKKKEILQKFLQKFLIDTDVLKWEDVFLDEKPNELKAPKKLSLLALNREIFEFFSRKAISKRIDSLPVFAGDYNSQDWKIKLFKILAKLKENKIWKLPIKAEGFGHPVIDINIYHLFEYESWDEVLKKKNYFGNDVARFVLEQIEKQKSSFFKNAKYFLKLKLNRLWNTWYGLKLFLTIKERENNNVHPPFSLSSFLKKNSGFKQINTYTWFLKKVYDDAFQDAKKKYKIFSLKKPVLDFFKKTSCFLLQYDYNNQLLEFVDKETTLYSLSDNYRSMLSKYKASPKEFNFKNLFYKLAPQDLENSDTKCDGKIKKITSLSTNSRTESSYYSFFLSSTLIKIKDIPKVLKFEYLTIYELKLLLFLKETYHLFNQNNNHDFSTFFKKIVSDSIIAEFNFYIPSFLNNWKDFLKRDAFLNIPEKYPFFDNENENPKEITLLFESWRALLLLLQNKNIETFVIFENFQIDVLTKEQQKFFIDFSEKLKEIKKDIKKIKNKLPRSLTKNLKTENPTIWLLKLEKERQKRYFQKKVSIFSQYYPIVNKMYLLGNSQITISNKSKVEKKIDLNEIYFLKRREDLKIDYLSVSQIINIINVTKIDLDDFRQEFAILLKKDIGPIWEIIYQYLNIDNFDKEIQELCVNFTKFHTKKPIFFTKKQLNSQNCLRNVKKTPLVDLAIFATGKTNRNPVNLPFPVLEEISKIRHFKSQQINDVFYFFMNKKIKKTQTNQFSDLVILTFFYSTLSFLFCFLVFLINIQKIYQTKWKKERRKISFL